MKDENKITKIIYDYFAKFYYFMMTSSVTSAFFWQVVLSEFTIRQDLSLYVWCDLETVSILLTRNMNWLLLLWSKLRDCCISYRLVCNAADFYHSEYRFLSSVTQKWISFSHKIGPLRTNQLAGYRLFWKIHVWQLFKQK